MKIGIKENNMQIVTNVLNFYQGHDPRCLIETFGSPLYVYNERILRERCKEMITLSAAPNFSVNYAMKANTNIHLMSIIREEGLYIDASSVGEIVAAIAAGFDPENIMLIVNSVSAAELQQALDIGVNIISVDSISQLETYGKMNPSGKIALRFNSGIGGGHHEKVVTGGDGTKFGIMPEYIPQTKEILNKYNLKLIGINHHIGSQNWGDLYLQGADALLKIAKQFDDLEFIDLGGGFAIPYNKQDGEKPMDLRMLNQSLDKLMREFTTSYGKQVKFIIEPGRYIAAECGVLLGTVHSLKNCGSIRYAGTDLGFSVLARTTLYDAYHDIEVYGNDMPTDTEVVSIVGNQCESGDYIAKGRRLPKLTEGNVLGILDAGAYGYSMSSQYNHRARPAEILIQLDGNIRLIRHRDTFEDMLQNMKGL